MTDALPVLERSFDEPPELVYPYFDTVPKLPKDNEEWRDELRKKCRNDLNMQRVQKKMCAEDSLYWLVSSTYLFEPRPKPHVIGFLPWSHQIPVWKDMERYLGYCDVGLEKSRGEGASWMISMLCIHKWLFVPMFAAGIVSKDERSVDDPENPDSIFWKLDFCVKHLPPWMRPKYARIQKTHMLVNKDNGATISGFAATGDVASGGRKAQPLDAKILTPIGWRLMGELKVGDQVIGSNGQPTTVEGVYPLGVKKVYRVDFSDKVSTECCDEHLWAVTHFNTRYQSTLKQKNTDAPVSIKSLREIMVGYKTQRANGDVANTYQIPMMAPAYLTPTKMPIDPYLVGCLLGDGYLGGNGICYASDDQELMDTLSGMIPATCCVRKMKHQVYYFPRRAKSGPNDLKRICVELGMWGKRAWEKEIPDAYKFAELPTDRLALLQGLMDTDGTVSRTSPRHTICSFTTASRQLADDVRWLVQSLGGTARVSRRKTSYRANGELRKGRESYQLIVAMPFGMNPFRLSRKANIFAQRVNKPIRSIVCIQEIGEKPVQCIKVAATDQLYVTDNCIVTHNTVFICDELSKFRRGPDKEALNSTQYVTDCRYLISTPKGPDGAYFEAMNGKSNLKKLILDWKQNPVRSQGAYKVLIATDDHRKLEIVDIPYWKKKGKFKTDGDVIKAASHVEPDKDNPFGYRFMMLGPFVKHDQLRSPWYDWECQRPSVTPSDIAQELDRDYGGSSSRFFDINMLMRLQGLCQDPHVRGTLRIPAGVESHLDLDRPKFVTMHGGKLALWFKPDLAGHVPPNRNYVIGADICAGGSGVETSNSVLCVLDRMTGRQVAEYASPELFPVDLADYAVALCYWFTGNSGPALLAWEANGPNGATFGKRITQLGYGNIYYRGQTEEFSERDSRKIGFWTGAKTKPPLLAEFARALEAGQLEINSKDCLEEGKFYVNKAGGKIEHIAESAEKDPSGAGERHGDRVISAAIAWWVAKEYILDGKSADAIAADVPPNCALGRRRESQQKDVKPTAWVPPSQRRFAKQPFRR